MCSHSEGDFMDVVCILGVENDFEQESEWVVAPCYGTYPKLVLCAMEPQFLQTDGQVVHTDPSVSVHVQDLEEDLEAMLLLGPATHCAHVRLVFRRMEQSVNTNTPKLTTISPTDPTAWVWEPILLRAALAKHIAHNRRDERALLVHHAKQMQSFRVWW